MSLSATYCIISNVILLSHDITLNKTRKKNVILLSNNIILNKTRKQTSVKVDQKKKISN